MTAEIAIANKWGIALAADSAVTTERLHKNKIQEKIYNSANKLFSFSKFHPVGAMFYNTVSIGGVPWETVIKMTRGKLKRQSFATVDEYASFLFSYIHENGKILFNTQNENFWIFLNCYRVLLKHYTPKKTTRKQFVDNIDKAISALEKADSLDGMDATFEKNILARYREQIDEAVNLAFNGSAAHSKRKIDRLVQLSFIKKKLLKEYSGLVICGFGENDVFPQLVEYYCDGVVCGRVRHWEKNQRRIDLVSGAFIIPFADTEIVRTLTQGVNPKFQKKYNDEAIKMIASLPGEIISQITQLSEDEKRNYIESATTPVVDAFKAFSNGMAEYRRKEHVEPIEDTIAMLPLSELASVAEAFLNTSQIHKKVNPESETVGGPVDVAVISKGDGFVWIKRKHYFKEEFNKSFVQRYLES